CLRPAVARSVETPGGGQRNLPKAGQHMLGALADLETGRQHCDQQEQLGNWRSCSIQHQFSLPNRPQRHTTSPMNKRATILCVSTALLFQPNVEARNSAGSSMVAGGEKVAAQTTAT